MPLCHSNSEFSKQVEVIRPATAARRKRPGPLTPSRIWGRQIGATSLRYNFHASEDQTKPNWLAQDGEFTIALTAGASIIGAVIGGWYAAAILASIALVECLAMTAYIRTDANRRR